MSRHGEFPDDVRLAIYEAGQGRCIGCGRTDVTAQHRRARGIGGTRLPVIGSPANGVPLCGSGTHGCHGWTEANPDDARLLGWRLEVGQDPEGAPFYTRNGWWRWGIEDNCWLIWYVDPDDLDRHPERVLAVERFTRALAAREAA